MNLEITFGRELSLSFFLIKIPSLVGIWEGGKLELFR